MHVSYSVKELLSNWLGTTMTQNPDIPRSIWENRAIIFIDQIKCAHYVCVSRMINVPTERRSNKQLKRLPGLLPARPDPIQTATFLLCTQTFDDGRHTQGAPAGRVITGWTRLNVRYYPTHKKWDLQQVQLNQPAFTLKKNLFNQLWPPTRN